MQDTLIQMTHVDDYTLTVILVLAAIVFGLIRTLVDSFSLAVIFAPMLVLGGLAANYLFRVFYISATPDKDSEVVIASAVGILVALVLLLMATWLSAVMSERRSRNKRVLVGLEIARQDGDTNPPA